MLEMHVFKLHCRNNGTSLYADQVAYESAHFTALLARKTITIFIHINLIEFRRHLITSICIYLIIKLLSTFLSIFRPNINIFFLLFFILMQTLNHYFFSPKLFPKQNYICLIHRFYTRLPSFIYILQILLKYIL